MPNAIFWDSVDTDLDRIYQFTRQWVKGNQPRMPANVDLGVDQVALIDMYESMHVMLSMFGDSANCCKKSATLMIAFCIYAPIAVKGLEIPEGFKEKLQMLNAEAAYEIAEVIARNANHDTPTEMEGWSFKEKALFPSHHSYFDFIRNLVRFRTAKWINLTPEQMEVAIHQAALLLELLFYRTNPEIAGIADASMCEGLHPGYDILKKQRNAETRPPTP